MVRFDRCKYFYSKTAYFGTCLIYKIIFKNKIQGRCVVESFPDSHWNYSLIGLTVLHSSCSEKFETFVVEHLWWRTLQVHNQFQICLNILADFDE